MARSLTVVFLIVAGVGFAGIGQTDIHLGFGLLAIGQALTIANSSDRQRKD